MLAFSRELRKSGTEAERLLWARIRNRRLGGYRFKRQVQFKPYIVDFVCLKSKLIIELDGSQHQDAKEYDLNRTDYLESLGFKVVRFWNSEVTKDLNVVLRAIYEHLTNPHPPCGHPLPQLGEGNS
ncbi:MAG: endonuclease domain-containing protein [Gammaproteobacteria bacterium]